MATKYYGGDGPPNRTVGEFEVKYSATSPDGRRTDHQQSFTEYTKAEEFYEGIDDTAFLWDITGMPELCAGKTRIAYYSGLLWKGRENHQGAVRRLVAVETDDAEQAARLLAHIGKQSGLKLDLVSIHEVDEAEYERNKVTVE
jgi:hypothetical protein